MSGPIIPIHMPKISRETKRALGRLLGRNPLWIAAFFGTQLGYGEWALGAFEEDWLEVIEIATARGVANNPNRLARELQVRAIMRKVLAKYHGESKEVDMHERRRPAISGSVSH